MASLLSLLLLVPLALAAPLELYSIPDSGTQHAFLPASLTATATPDADLATFLTAHHDALGTLCLPFLVYQDTRDKAKRSYKDEDGLPSSFSSCIFDLLRQGGATFASEGKDLLPQLRHHVLSGPESRLVEFALPSDKQPYLKGDLASETVLKARLTEGEKALLKFVGVERYRDITEAAEWTSFADAYGRVATLGNGVKRPFPGAVAYGEKRLKTYFDRLKVEDMKAFLAKFTSFRTRYYRSETGKASQKFLLEEVKKIATLNSHLNITVTEFPHRWGQNSIIARVILESAKTQSTTPSAEEEPEIVIIGAHQDSTNMIPFLPAPGADDDGSGTTTVLAAFKALVEGEFKVESEGEVRQKEGKRTKKQIEYHWYSAEEGGLLGSAEVAKYYKEQGWAERVRSMVQMDMTAWVKSGTTESIGIIGDYVDLPVTQFLRLLVKEYAEIPYVETKCGYACSDHASWSGVGAASAFIIESTFEDHNPHIHSSSDTMSVSKEFSVEHMKQFARVVIAYVLELAAED